MRLVDSAGAPIPDAVITWRVVSGEGALEVTTSTGADGLSTASYTLGTLAGLQSVAAHATELGGPATLFTVTAINELPAVLARRSGDQLIGEVGTALTGPLQVRLGDQYGNPVSGVTVAWTVEGGGGVTPETSVTDPSGVASATRTLGDALGLQRTLAVVPDAPTLTVEFTTQAVAPIPLVSTIPVGQNQYGAHDSFVRDGIAFLAGFDHGLLIYDVGNGMAGGTPEVPVFLSRISTVGTSETNGTVFTNFPSVHNVWWMWHNGERRYALIGEEGIIDLPRSAQGDVHVVDVSDLRAPREVAHYDLPGAGAHYFYLDEARQILYAAFYNGGVVALDVSGTLEGDLAGRELGRIAPGGPGRTFTYGVQLVGENLYASDMLSGIWQLRLGPGGFTVLGGGNNLPADPQRQGSEVAAGTGFLYSGTRIGSGRRSPVLDLGARRGRRPGAGGLPVGPPPDRCDSRHQDLARPPAAHDLRGRSRRVGTLPLQPCRSPAPRPRGPVPAPHGTAPQLPHGELRRDQRPPLCPGGPGPARHAVHAVRPLADREPFLAARPTPARLVHQGARAARRQRLL